jgi:hypothetical protein
VVESARAGASEHCTCASANRATITARHARASARSSPTSRSSSTAGSREAHDEHRRVARPVDGVLDEPEQRRLRPVDVFEQEDQRPFARERLEELAECRERLLRAHRGGGIAEPDGRGDAAVDEWRGRAVAAEPGHDLGQPART